MYYLNCFLIYSILGFLLETLVAYIMKTGFQSGILYGPWTPVYGIGVVVILLLSDYFFMNLHMPRWLESIIVFFIVALFLSCLELIGGVLIEKTMHVTFWNYTSQKYHIGKYISIEMTFIWGIASILFIYIVNPILKRFVVKVPLWLSILGIILMSIDYIVTLCLKIKK